MIMLSWCYTTYIISIYIVLYVGNSQYYLSWTNNNNEINHCEILYLSLGLLALQILDIYGAEGFVDIKIVYYVHRPSAI